MPDRILSAICAVLLFAMLPILAPAKAQTPPPGWSKQEMDRFVEAVSESVAKKLGENAKAAAGVAKPVTAGRADASADAIHLIVTRLGEILGSAPRLFHHIADLPALLDYSQKGGLGFMEFLLHAGMIAAMALGAEWATRLATGGIVRRIVRDVSSPPPWMRWIALTAVEALAILALGVVGNTIFASLFLKGGDQARIAGALLMALFWWRVGLSVLRCWLRPRLAAGRLAPVDDQDAAALMRGFAIATAVPVVSRAWIGVLTTTGATRDEIVLQQFLNSPVIFGVFIATVLALKGPVARWLEELMALRSRESWDRYLASRWHFGALTFYLLMFVAVSHGGISGRTDLPTALNDLQMLLMGWLLIETVLYCIHKRRKQEKAAAAVFEPLLEDIAWRGADILVRIAVAIVLVRIVATEVLNVVPASAWAGYSATLMSAGLVLFAAWALWQVAKYYFEKVGGPVRGPVMPGAEEPEDDEEKLEGASRLRTLMPVLKSVVGVLLFGLTILLVLSQLGVNITPLLAGASIFGLALSFGSQSLVRDIVSGVFFLADDAFRVGEYIDIGKAKGTVESFTLRSIRLRHQGGQIHTIPFGQLGQITNFSRDWATVKFNLRFARDTDVEALRKAAKKIGLELMEDPDIKDDFLLPLKMQGIADIQDNALIARFKFTVRPGRPSYIQRLAIKRMLQVFPEKGIEFASATVAVRSLDGGPPPLDIMAAATRAGVGQAPAPAAL